MSTLSQGERQALNDIFVVISQKEKRTSKVKNSVINFFYFVFYFFKTKKNKKLTLR